MLIHVMPFGVPSATCAKTRQRFDNYQKIKQLFYFTTKNVCANNKFFLYLQTQGY